VSFNYGLALCRLGDQMPLAVRSLKEAIKTWEKARRPPAALLDARALLDSAKSAATSRGAWTDYWFGGSVPLFRRCLGLLLFFALAFVLSLVVVEKDLIRGIETPLKWNVAAVLAGMLFALLVLPTVDRLKVGTSGIDVASAAPATETAKVWEISADIKPNYSIERVTSTPAYAPVWASPPLLDT
jgi:hypothetical protein